MNPILAIDNKRHIQHAGQSVLRCIQVPRAPAAIVRTPSRIGISAAFF